MYVQLQALILGIQRKKVTTYIMIQYISYVTIVILSFFYSILPLDMIFHSIFHSYLIIFYKNLFYVTALSEPSYCLSGTNNYKKNFQSQINFKNYFVFYYIIWRNDLRCWLRRILFKSNRFSTVSVIGKDCRQLWIALFDYDKKHSKLLFIYILPRGLLKGATKKIWELKFFVENFSKSYFINYQKYSKDEPTEILEVIILQNLPKINNVYI